MQVRHGGQSHAVGELNRWLEEELLARERTIAEEDRRLFESFLVGGLADALRERISGAAALVAGMNDALGQCTTSSGMRIELEWRARVHDDAGLREAVALLRRDVALLTDDARSRLVEFLRRRIEDARHSLEQGSSTEHVMAALDYREWHEFRVIQLKDGRRETLTRRLHQQGSGGEKAVALHLPLFAAAAAQFAAARDSCPTDDPPRRGVCRDRRTNARPAARIARAFRPRLRAHLARAMGLLPRVLGARHLPPAPRAGDSRRRDGALPLGWRATHGGGLIVVSPEAIRYLSRPALRRLLFAARERFERNAGPNGRLLLHDLTPEEAHALNGLLTPHPSFVPSGDARIRLPRLDAVLRESRFAVSLEDALVAVDGPLGNRRAEREAAAGRASCRLGAGTRSSAGLPP